jgi:hypothetical protein
MSNEPKLMKDMAYVWYGNIAVVWALIPAVNAWLALSA